VRSSQKQKPTFGSVTEVGCLRFDLSLPYRAIPPHTGALLPQQQMQTPILILWLMGHYLSYSGARESQFTRGFSRKEKPEPWNPLEARSWSSYADSSAGEAMVP
jgi:hypothetical protein